jgi:hypothetical protein
MYIQFFTDGKNLILANLKIFVLLSSLNILIPQAHLYPNKKSKVIYLAVHGSVPRNINLTERINKMRLYSRIYYSNVS